jgi:hypothetical protein
MSAASARRRWIAGHGVAKPCPWCGSSATERSAEFGPFHMSETYVCLACKSPFSRIKWGDPVEPENPRE